VAALAVLRRNGFVFQGYNLFPHLSLRWKTSRCRCARCMARAMPRRTRALELLEPTRPGRASATSARPSSPAASSSAAPSPAPWRRRPRLLLLDEPTSALDPVMTGEVLDVIRELAEGGQQIVLATHEISFARLVADWVVFLAGGRVLESRPAAEFFAAPVSAEAVSYLGGLTRYR
jgi:polar amino acid transport system ATP-binding protein